VKSIDAECLSRPKGESPPTSQKEMLRKSGGEVRFGLRKRSVASVWGGLSRGWRLSKETFQKRFTARKRVFSEAYEEEAKGYADLGLDKRRAGEKDSGRKTRSSTTGEKIILPGEKRGRARKKT